MAIAALMTAWSAYQSDQWGDTMSISFSQAGAARTEATRLYTRAGQLSSVDVQTFLAWLDAAYQEIEDGDIDVSEGYVPDPQTLSGIIYERFRAEFRPAMDAWLATRPLITEGAPPTPFAMDEYQVSQEVEAEELQATADEKAAAAIAADNNDDKYVLSTIVFAAVFLFAGMSTKMRSTLGQRLMLGISVAFLIGAGIFLATIPKQV
jgi:hypothetical protein